MPTFGEIEKRGKTYRVRYRDPSYTLPGPKPRITALSHQTGLRRPLLSQRLNNHSPLTLAELDKIAQALGTSPTVIIANAEQRRNAFASSELVDDSRSPSTAQ